MNGWHSKVIDRKAYGFLSLPITNQDMLNKFGWEYLFECNLNKILKKNWLFNGRRLF